MTMMVNMIYTTARFLAIAVVLASISNGVAHATTADAKHECLIEPMIVAQVGSQVQGVIDKLLVDRGESVQKGQAIATLKSSVERANLQQAETRADMKSEIKARQADLTLAKQSLSRMESLHKKNMVPSQHRDEAEAQLHVAKAALKQANENYQLLQLELDRARHLLEQRTIVSPVDGVVVEQQTFPGEFIYENPVMTVAQLHPLRVEVFLPGRLFNQFAEGDLATIHTELGDEPLTAIVDVVDRLLDTRSGTFGVRLLLPNAEYAITSGQKCQLEFRPAIASAD